MDGEGEAARCADPLGALWAAGPAATAHLDGLLTALLKVVDDDDAAVAAAARQALCVIGGACALDVSMPLLLRQIGAAADPDGDPAEPTAVKRRGLLLAELSALVGGARPDALGPLLPPLLAALASPSFCVPPSAADEERAAACTATQLRLVSLLRSLVAAAPAHCTATPARHDAYCALMRIAAVPSSAGRGFAAQQASLDALEELAVAWNSAVGGGGGAGKALHAEHLPALLQMVVGGPVAQWKVDTSEWHLLQTLIRQCDGATAAAQLLHAAPALATVLDPKREPPLRLTALSLVDHLLSTPGFTAAPELKEWAPLVLDGMLLPNLVWRAGRAAEHVRLGSMLCLSKLLPLRLVDATELGERAPTVLPVLTNCLDDDATETRRLACVVVRHAVDQLGSARLNEEAVRALYPELLKRLDDASDGVRLTCCEPLAALLAAASYSPTYAAGANLNKTNLQYFLRGLLVHLDDPAAEIQRAVAAVLRAALPLDAGVFTDEVKAVRDRHRSPRMCDQLLEEAAKLGTVV